MSFRCQLCNEAQPVNTSPVRVVTRVRARETRWEAAEWEIAEEKDACPACADGVARIQMKKESRDEPISLAEEFGS